MYTPLMSATLLPYQSHPAPATRRRPFFDSGVSAGAALPADSANHQWLDLNHHLIEHPAATFFVRVNGDSMVMAGIHDGDMLIVDRALKPTHGDVVVALVNGDMTVKRLSLSRQQCRLMPENPAFQPIIIHDGMDFEIWGVVTSAIHPVR